MGAGGANVSAMQVMTLDNNNQAQLDILLRTSVAPLSLPSITTNNIATWSNTSVMSVGRGNIAIRSATTEVVGNVIATNLSGNLLGFSIDSGGPIKLDNCIIRSFKKTLNATVRRFSNICLLTNKLGGYVVELNVIQSEVGASISKKYQFAVSKNATSGAYHRLLPISSSSSNDEWGVEIQVDTAGTAIKSTGTILRLVRLSRSVTANLECILTVYQSRADPVGVFNSDVTGSNVTFSTILCASTDLTQSRVNVGIGTDTPGSTLDVAGRVSAVSLTSATNINVGTRVGAIGSIVDSTVLSQGAYISHNRQNDQRVDFISKRGGGEGGFHFWRSDGSGTGFGDNKLRLATLNSGGINLPSGASFSAPGCILNSVFATGTGFSDTEGISISPTSLTSSTLWRTVATYTYTPRNNASRLSLYFDMDYSIGGAGSDNFRSRITVDTTEVSFKQQNFSSNTTAGTGTRSNVIFPISALVNNQNTTSRTIRIEIFHQSDDTLTLSSTNWVFKLLERKG